MPLSPDGIERKLIAFIETHIDTYLAAQEADEPERADVFPLPRPGTVAKYSSETNYAEQPLPAIVIQTGPSKGKRGISRATWDAEMPIVLAVLTEAADALDARANAGTYIAALRWMFTTQQTIDGLAQGVDYISDGLTEPLTVGESRRMAAGELDLTILIRGIADRTSAPGAQEPVESAGIHQQITVEGSA